MRMDFRTSGQIIMMSGIATWRPKRRNHFTMTAAAMTMNPDPDRRLQRAVQDDDGDDEDDDDDGNAVVDDVSQLRGTE